MADQIYIRDLTLSVIIGTNPEERLTRQNIILNLELQCDLTLAGRSDNLDDTVDYFSLYQQIVSLAETSNFFLLERFAQAVAELSLCSSRVRAVTVTLDKPAVLPLARAASIRITREQ